MSTNTVQVGGDHYKSKGIQPWDFIVTNNLGYLEGNIIKYVSRHREKGGVTDLLKAKHYLEKLIETSKPVEVKPAGPTVTISAAAPFGFRPDGVPYKRGPYRKRKTAKKGKA
jgi:Protein of unknwon function (DUF3310)